MTPMPTKPFKEIVEGSVKLAAWRKTVHGTTRYSIVVQKLFKDAETGNWRSTKYLSAGDLGSLLMAAIRMATTLGALRANERAGHAESG